MRRLDDIIHALPAESPGWEIDRDRWRLETHYFGPHARAGSLDPDALFLGAGSGLFPLLRALETPLETVWVVEGDRKHAKAIKASARRLGISNLVFLDQVSDFQRASLDRIGLVVFEKEYLDPEALNSLTLSGGIDLLLGTFDESLLNPLWLHRWSRQNALRFHLQNESVGLPLVGQFFEGPDLSIIVPAYGIEKYLDQCLSSLTQQTLKAVEILVVDDGAKDRSGLIADEWAERDPRVRVIHQANAGCAAARSNGLKEARGYWVGFVDGDDWVDTAMFEALLESSVRFTSDIAQCGYRHCYDNDARSVDEVEHHNFKIPWGRASGLIQNPKDLIPLRPTIWRRIYRTDFLKDHGLDFPVHIRRFDDLPFHFMTLALADRLSVVGGCYYQYRQQRPGQDINIRDERLHVHFPIFRLLRDFVRAHASFDLEALFFKTQLASHSWALTMIDPSLAKAYRRAVKFDLFGDPLVMSTREKLRVSKDLGRRRAGLARSIRRQMGSGEAEWMKVRDDAH